MLIRYSTKPMAAQRGAILIITLIALVAMTLSSVALVRSVDTANVIAGNLQFQQTATFSTESGVAAAYTWLQTNNSQLSTSILNGLDASALQNTGYVAAGLTQMPSSGESWDHYWNDSLAGLASTPQTDLTGNSVSYVIQRLCATTGDPNDVAPPVCALPPSDSAGGSMGAGVVAPKTSTQVYYRITVRIQGPRNTLGYVQAIAVM
jgi:Tfp pilus assembly protein PilX